MRTAVTIREHVLEALAVSAPHGLTMATIAGAVTGPWRERQVTEVVRKLWGAGELARRHDGTFIPTGRARHSESRPERVQRSHARLQAAVRKVAAGARREGYDAPLTVRRVDPALLSAFCPVCRETVHPRLDGTCTRCGCQCGANVETTPSPRRRRRRRPLRKGQAGYGTACRCGARKSKQAHACRACAARRRVGRKVAGGEKRRRPKKMSEEQLLRARGLYASGLSLRQVAVQIHPETSYASVKSCAEGLYGMFATRGWKLRPQREITRARNFKHGRRPRASTAEQDRAYRRWLAKERGWEAVSGPGRPPCRALRRNAPGKGRPCEHHALGDSEYCWAHDPRYELERQAQTARMRARAPEIPTLPAGPHIAWLRSLHEQRGSWKRVGELTGLGSQAHRWGNGQTSAGKPLVRVSVRAVRRSAERAGTSVEAIYGKLDRAEAA